MSWQIYPHPMVILQIPVLTAHYHESLSFGRPGLGRSTPHQMANSQITVKFKFHSYSESSTFGRPGLSRSTRLIKGNFTDSCSTLRAHIWQTKCWQIYPLSNGNFTDFCSDSSYFIPTLRAHHLTDQVLADLTPHIRWQFNRFLWNSYFIPTLRAQHLADQVLADLPTLIKWQFHRFLLYSESS